MIMNTKHDTIYMGVCEEYWRDFSRYTIRNEVIVTEDMLIDIAHSLCGDMKCCKWGLHGNYAVLNVYNTNNYYIHFTYPIKGKLGDLLTTKGYREGRFI